MIKTLMKILLINPYGTRKRDLRVYPAEPLGLLCLATYLNRAVEAESLDITTRILDAELLGADHCIKTEHGYRSGLSDTELEAEFTSFKPDVVGITSNYTNSVGDVLQIASLAKKTLPDTVTVVGGAHATIAHPSLAKNPDIDVVVRSEGEETFLELALALNAGNPLTGIKGITYTRQGEVIIEDDRPLIEDINSLPVPDRSLVPYEEYLAHSDELYVYPMNAPIATIFTARGCPYKCIFCSTQKVWRNHWRGRSAEKILEEIDYLTSTYGVREIAFEDDQLMGDRNRIKDLCRLLIERNSRITLLAPPGISPSLIDEETLRLMKRAGFYRICLSIDVGAEKSKAFVKKPIRLDKMRSVVKKANAAGLWSYATFVIGFPDETIEDLNETVRFAYSLKLDFLIFYIAQPHLGSSLYDYYLEHGLLKQDQVLEHNIPTEPVFGTKHVSAAQLQELRDAAAGNYVRFHLRHFLNPIYVIQEFLPKLVGRQRLRYLFRIAANAGSMIRGTLYRSKKKPRSS